ncbi:MAG: thiamine phosphate synthase [Alphaproteobacteria bacterium]|nr:thiamine phosphate synthase [Alphaproteobacteria bacterium]
MKMRAAARRKSRPDRLPALFLLSDPRRLPDPVALLDRLPRGAAVVLRHYDAPGRIALARRLIKEARRRGIVVLVAGDWRLAVRLGADGVHLPERAMAARLPVGVAVRSKKLFVTIAAHSANSLFLAARFDPDAAILSPVFQTASHPGRIPLGPLRFAALCRKSPVPVIALGGIDERNAPRILDSGAAGIAGISGIVRLSTAPGRLGMARRARLV